MFKINVMSVAGFIFNPLIILFYKLYFAVVRAIAWVLDMLTQLFFIFSGMTPVASSGAVADENGEIVSTDLLNFFIQDEAFTQAYIYLCLVALGLIVVFAIGKIIKQDYFERSGPRSKAPIFRNIALSFIAFICVIPVFMFLLEAAGALALLVMNVLGYDGGGVGTMLFKISWDTGGFEDIVAWAEKNPNNGSYDPNNFGWINDNNLFREYFWASSDTFDVREGAHEFYWYVFIFAGLVLIVNLGKMMVAMVTRLYKLIVLFIIAPSPISQIVIDDGVKFKKWKDSVLQEALKVVGCVMCFLIFMLIASAVPQLDLMRFAYTPESAGYVSLIEGNNLTSELSNSVKSLYYSGTETPSSFDSAVNALGRCMLLIAGVGAIQDMDQVITPLLSGGGSSMELGNTGNAVINAGKSAAGAAWGLAKLGVSASAGLVSGGIDLVSGIISAKKGAEADVDKKYATPSKSDGGGGSPKPEEKEQTTGGAPENAQTPENAGAPGNAQTPENAEASENAGASETPKENPKPEEKPGEKPETPKSKDEKKGEEKSKILHSAAAIEKLKKRKGRRAIEKELLKGGFKFGKGIAKTGYKAASILGKAALSMTGLGSVAKGLSDVEKDVAQGMHKTFGKDAKTGKYHSSIGWLAGKAGEGIVKGASGAFGWFDERKANKIDQKEFLKEIKRNNEEAEIFHESHVENPNNTKPEVFIKGANTVGEYAEEILKAGSIVSDSINGGNSNLVLNKKTEREEGKVPKSKMDIHYENISNLKTATKDYRDQVEAHGAASTQAKEAKEKVKVTSARVVDSGKAVEKEIKFTAKHPEVFPSKQPSKRTVRIAKTGTSKPKVSYQTISDGDSMQLERIVELDLEILKNEGFVSESLYNAYNNGDSSSLSKWIDDEPVDIYMNDTALNSMLDKVVRDKVAYDMEEHGYDNLDNYKQKLKSDYIYARNQYSDKMRLIKEALVSGTPESMQRAKELMAEAVNASMAMNSIKNKIKND